MTDHASYLGIPAASDAGRVVRALQAAKQLRFSEIAQAIRAQHSDALAAIKQLAERGVVQVRHTDGEPVAVLTSKPEEPDDPPKAKPAEEKKTPPPPAEKPKKATVKAPFTPNHPEQVAYEQTCSTWLTDGTSDREKYAYRDGHHAGWRNATEGLEEICAALRLAIADKRAFAICVEGRNGATMTLHNCDDGTIAARMLERFARQQRSGAKA